MSLSLDTIKPKNQQNKSSRRIGRGDGSGRGTYSGRGMKGQKARSGTSGLLRLALKNVISQTPKKRGFKSFKDKNQVIDLEQINKNFKDGDEITLDKLFEIGLIEKKNIPVKILGDGELKIKNLTITGVKVSNSASEKLQKNGSKLK